MANDGCREEGGPLRLPARGPPCAVSNPLDADDLDGAPPSQVAQPEPFVQPTEQAAEFVACCWRVTHYHSDCRCCGSGAANRGSVGRRPFAVPGVVVRRGDDASWGRAGQDFRCRAACFCRGMLASTRSVDSAAAVAVPVQHPRRGISALLGGWRESGRHSAVFSPSCWP